VECSWSEQWKVKWSRFVSYVDSFDVISFVEILKSESPGGLPGFSTSFVVKPSRHKGRGRPYGGIAIYIKPHIRKQGSPNQAKWATSSPWFQWSRPISVKKRSFSRPVSLFKSVFFSPIIILFFNIHIKGAPMFLKCDPYRVWCSIFYSKLVIASF
jgi:hypothetical protein